MPNKLKSTVTATSTGDVVDLINQSLGKISDAVKVDGQKFFPNGIELISVEVAVANIKVIFKVAGPKAASLLSQTQLEPKPEM